MIYDCHSMIAIVAKRHQAVTGLSQKYFYKVITEG